MEYLILNSFLGISLFETDSFINMFMRLAFNLIVTVIIVRFLYYPIAKRKDYLFTYILISVVVFFLCYMLGEINLQIGFALGLFAIFGIIRYRTTTIPIKEMTYLFIVIGISVINSLTTEKVTFAELLLTNLTVIAITYGLERFWLLKHESSKTIIYEKIDLIKPEKRLELKEDLENRTGLKIHRIRIGRIDFMQDIARIRIYYFEDKENDYFEDEEYERLQDND